MCSPNRFSRIASCIIAAYISPSRMYLFPFTYLLFRMLIAASGKRDVFVRCNNLVDRSCIKLRHLAVAA